MNTDPDLSPVTPESKQKHANKAAWGAMFAGAALSVYGWTRKSASGAALGLAGGAIALKAASAGPIADLVGTETSWTHSVITMATPSDIYSFCKRARIVPLWTAGMRELLSPSTQSTTEDHPTPTPGIAKSEFKIVEDVLDKCIRWHIADSRRSGDCIAELKIADISPHRGSLVTLSLSYKLHTGILHSGAPRIIGADPQRHVRESLRKLKMLIEAGEIATIEGQPHGPRTLKGKLMGALLREEAA